MEKEHKETFVKLTVPTAVFVIMAQELAHALKAILVKHARLIQFLLRAIKALASLFRPLVI